MTSQYVYIAYGEDLYRFLITNELKVTAIEVSRGNRCQTWQEVELTDLPRRVLEDLKSKVAHHL